jgi:GTPase SAR1 family protein
MANSRDVANDRSSRDLTSRERSHRKVEPEVPGEFFSIILVGIAGAGKTTVIGEMHKSKSTLGYGPHRYVKYTDLDKFGFHIPPEASVLNADLTGSNFKWIIPKEIVAGFRDSIEEYGYAGLIAGGSSSNLEDYLPLFDHVIILGSSNPAEYIDRMESRVKEGKNSFKMDDADIVREHMNSLESKIKKHISQFGDNVLDFRDVDIDEIVLRLGELIVADSNLQIKEINNEN